MLHPVTISTRHDLATIATPNKLNNSRAHMRVHIQTDQEATQAGFGVSLQPSSVMLLCDSIDGGVAHQ